MPTVSRSRSRRSWRRHSASLPWSALRRKPYRQLRDIVSVLRCKQCGPPDRIELYAEVDEDGERRTIYYALPASGETMGPPEERPAKDATRSPLRFTNVRRAERWR